MGDNRSKSWHFSNHGKGIQVKLYVDLLYLLWYFWNVLHLECVTCSFLKSYILYFISKEVVYHSLVSRCESTSYYWLRPPLLRPVHRYGHGTLGWLVRLIYFYYYYYYETHLSVLFNFKMNLYIDDLIIPGNLALLFWEN